MKFSIDKIKKMVYYAIARNVKIKIRAGENVLDAAKIGERLTKLRGGLPQDKVAKAVGISVSALSMYETGNRIPRDEIKVKLARYYNSNIEEIFFKI